MLKAKRAEANQTRLTKTLEYTQMEFTSSHLFAVLRIVVPDLGPS